MKTYISAILILFASNNVYALGLNTGADVLRACQTAEDFLAGKNDDSRNAEACVHFLMGFDSGQSVSSLTRDQAQLYCKPKDANIGSMISSIVVALRKDKTYHSAPAGIAAWKSLSTTWPCK